MNARDLDRHLDVWFDAVQPQTAPTDLLHDVFTVTRQTRQRRGFRGQLATVIAERRGRAPMEATPGLRVLLPALLAVGVLMAVVVAGAIRILPHPMVDGAIVVEHRFDAPPDGTGASHRLALLMPDGDVVPLHAEPTREICGSFSPDGTQLAYYSAPLDSSEPSSLDDFGEFDYRLAVGSAEPNGTWRLLAADLAPALHLRNRPVWSPRGDAIAIVVVTVTDGNPPSMKTDLVVVPSDGSAPVAIVSADGTTPGDAIRWITSPSWSPDGRWIAFRARAYERTGPQQSVNDRYVVAVVRPDGSDLRVLAEWPIEATLMWESLAWSPDSRWVAYNRNAPGTPRGEHEWDVFVVGVDAADDRRIADTDGSELVAEWSPDGKSIATWVYNDSVRIIDIASGALTDTALPDHFTGAIWSATGDRLAVFTNRDGEDTGSVWEITREGGEPRRLSESARGSCDAGPTGSAWQEMRR